jgi:small subunit ribosomal protein S14
MAKKSAVNRNEMVKGLVQQYAAKRDALKAIANDEARRWRSASRRA